MAVTGDIFNGLIFGNVNSINYGIYITGEAVYNAPERAVELVSVPSRNGAIAIDQGYWENIEVTYPAGCFADNQVDFANAVSDFRNAIMSQIGYQRLTDSYNPNEYRMAMYLSGLEVEVAQIGQAGEFELTFNAKPQRWLLTGEIGQAVTNNQVIINPTLHASEPLLEVDGYGTIEFNGYTIEMSDPYRGLTTLIEPATYYPITTDTPSISISETAQPYEVANAGDTVTVGSTTFQWYIDLYQLDYGDERITGCSVATSGSLTGTTRVLNRTNRRVQLVTELDAITYSLAAPTSTSGTYTVTATVNFYTNGSYATATQVFYITVSSSVNSSQRMSLSVYCNGTDEGSTRGDIFSPMSSSVTTGGVTVDSTEYLLGTPTYVDCELGECYKIENNEVIDLNSHIDLGSDLPKLASGSNTVTYDNTVTGLTIHPRWWQL